MCGIVGIYTRSNRVDENLVKKMANILYHRGPDDEGYYFDQHLGLGHRRLKIIDLTESGHQPLYNEDESILVVYNGEIYNYLELKEDLIKRRHRFKSATDTEVIIHLYEEHGYDCLNYLNGMFSFAIWDKNKQILFCARDRFGIKPFYYLKDGENFIFASEIKAILEFNKITPKINYRMLYHYLFYGKMDHTEETFFKDVLQLPPSHYILVRNNGMSIHRYYDFRKTKIPEGDITQDFYELFENSIKIQLRSDVPVGLLLSGGIDSTSIACLMDKLMKNSKSFKGSFETVSIGSDLTEFDESKYVKKAIEKINANSHIIYPDGKNLVQTLFKIIWFHDEPILGTSIYAHWHLMEKAKEQGVVVLLHGQGADELLCGYDWYLSYYLAELLRNKQFKRFFNEQNRYSKRNNLSKLFVLRYTLQKFLAEMSWLKFSTFIKGYKRYFDFNISKEEKNFRFYNKGDDLVSRRSYNDIFCLNLPYILHYEDRNSMAFSRESRVPFLDHQLAEFIFSLPLTKKIDGLKRKIVLREAMKNIIPEEIRLRENKLGFITPIYKWVSEDAKSEIERIFRSHSFQNRGFFNFSKINEAFKRYCAGEKKYQDIIWRALCVEIWLRIFFDKKWEFNDEKVSVDY